MSWISSGISSVSGSPCTIAKCAASAPLAVLTPSTGGRRLPENTWNSPGGSTASMTASADSSRYSTPLASTPTPTVPIHSSTPVASRRRRGPRRRRRPGGRSCRRSRGSPRGGAGPMPASASSTASCQRSARAWPARKEVAAATRLAVISPSSRVWIRAGVRGTDAGFCICCSRVHHASAAGGVAAAVVCHGGGDFAVGSALGCIAWNAASVAFCISRPWIVIRRTFKFMFSQFSTDLRSAMRFSISLGSRSGASTPDIGSPDGTPAGNPIGMPMGAHIFFNSSNGSWKGVSSLIAAVETGSTRGGPRQVDNEAGASGRMSLGSAPQKRQHLAAPRHGVLVAELDERLGERRLEQEVARERSSRCGSSRRSPAAGT